MVPLRLVHSLSQLWLALLWEVAPGLGTLSPALLAWVDQQGCFGLVDLWLWVWLVQLLWVMCPSGFVEVARQVWFQPTGQMVPWTGEDVDDFFCTVCHLQSGPRTTECQLVLQHAL